MLPVHQYHALRVEIDVDAVAEAVPAGSVASMQAIVIREPGEADVLEWTEVPDPAPKPGEVLIDVVASAVNRADVMQRRGFYPPPQDAPPYPGLEVSGRDRGAGPRRDRAERRRRGVRAARRRRVCGTGRGARRAGAAGAARGGRRRGRRSPGGRLHGVVERVHARRSAGGRDAPGPRRRQRHRDVAIQLAKARGARVVDDGGQRPEGGAMPGPRRGRDGELPRGGLRRTRRPLRRDPGRDRREVPGPQRGRARHRRPADGDRPAGRRKAELDIGKLLAKRARVHATALRSRPLDEKAEIVAGVRENVWPLLESGEVRPVVDRRFPMADAASAHG